MKSEKYLLNLYLFIYFGCAVCHEESLFPDQRLKFAPCVGNVES